MRGYAREVAFCQFYQNLFNKNDQIDFEFFDVTKVSDDDRTFIDTILQYAQQNKQQIDEKITQLSHSFKFDRIFRVDLALLQLAIAEMSACDTPFPIVINETVQLAKKYSTGKSVKFINGILASFVKDFDK